MQAGRARGNNNRWVKIAITALIVIIVLYLLFGGGGEHKENPPH